MQDDRAYIWHLSMLRLLNWFSTVVGNLITYRSIGLTNNLNLQIQDFQIQTSTLLFYALVTSQGHLNALMAIEPMW